MNREFILASNNKGKLKEFKEKLAEFGINVISQSEAGVNLKAEETGTRAATPSRKAEEARAGATTLGREEKATRATAAALSRETEEAGTRAATVG